MDILNILTDKTVIFFIANSLYVISYMLTSMLWLRVLAILAAASTFPYFYLQPEPLWSALFWQSCFLAVNAANLIVLLYSMRPPRFDELESLAYRLKFSDLKPHEAAVLFRLARTVRLSAGEPLLVEHEENETLFLLLEGRCIVRKGDRDVARLEAGEFVGELSFISGEVISADVLAEGEAALLGWKRSELEPLFRKQGLFHAYLHSLCSSDIAEKLRRMTAATPSSA
jgi:CRP-like cAMP-binding protein